MKFTKTTLAMAVTATMALGMAEQASASVYAGSRLLISDLLIGVTNLSQPALQGFTFTTNATANLNGVETVDGKTCDQISCSNVAPVLTSVASQGAPIRAAGDFTFFGPVHGTQTYSNGGAQINNAELSTGNPTSTNQISEVEIAGNGVGFATTAVGSETALNFVFNLAGTGNLSLKFKANPNIFVAVDTPGLVPPVFASGSISASFNLAGPNGTQISWAPNGQAGGFGDCDGVTSCTEVSDSINLNVTRTLPFGNPSSNGFSDARFGVDNGFQDFEILISGLAAGQHTLSLNTTTFARAQQNVPEPSLLALMGMSLAGISFARRRKSA